MRKKDMKSFQGHNIVPVVKKRHEKQWKNMKNKTWKIVKSGDKSRTRKIWNQTVNCVETLSPKRICSNFTIIEKGRKEVTIYRGELAVSHCPLWNHRWGHAASDEHHPPYRSAALTKYPHFATIVYPQLHRNNCMLNWCWYRSETFF